MNEPSPPFRSHWKRGPNWGFLDTDGALVIEPRFDAVGSFLRGRAIVVTGRLAGVIDRDGREILPSVFQRISLLTAGDAPLFQVVDARDGERRVGLYDLDGNEILPATFRHASGFFDGLCAVQAADGRYGYVDGEGKYRIRAEYDAATDFVGKLALVKVGPTLQILHLDGSVVAPVASPPLDRGAVRLTPFSSAERGIATYAQRETVTLVGRDGGLLTEHGELARVGILTGRRISAMWAASFD